MRYIGKQEIENIAVGAALLGTGGGGDPFIGKLMALQAIEEHGSIQVITPDELPDDALVIPTAMMGAPTVMVEKIPSGQEAKMAFEEIQQYLGKEVYATMPIEAGGVNSLVPFALAAQQGIPVVDADGMGRAFPELQMVTFYLEGVSATPMVLADDKGNTSLLNTINNVWAERIARVATVEMGGSVMLSIYPMTGKNVKATGIHHMLELEEKIGRTLREAKENPIQKLLDIVGGFELFKGKVSDIDRRTDAGFAKGVAKIQGFDEYYNESLSLHFQNEHLLAKKGDQAICMTPDLIAVLDAETAMPITTEGLRYGARCVVIGIPCDKKWRTKKAIETVGPKYFGYDVDYQPVEHILQGEVK
ncbi:DUF917 domain-containing protein [Gracilibacillus sp. HCP3S3_G5_1]|uniref:DUF917 domain-containing protein n=1 Tax=unclassified Gracilibacillus TaxID=2625209 RepID=UPI003F8CE711